MRKRLNAGDLQGAGCGNCGFLGRRDVGTYPYNPEFGQKSEVADNLKRQRQDYEAGRAVVDSFPAQIVIQVTEACNLRCSMCFQGHEPKHLPDEVWSKITPHLGRFDEINFTGGEPFVSKVVHHLIETIDPTSGVQLAFTTNGLLVHRFKEQLSKFKRVQLGISVDAATAATYEGIRIGGDWSALVDNVEWYAAERRKRRPYWDSGRLAYVIMRSNFNEIPAMVRWARAIEMPVLFCPVWGEFAAAENIFDHPELRAGLRPVAEILAEAESAAKGMPAHEFEETMTSLRHSLGKL